MIARMLTLLVLLFTCLPAIAGTCPDQRASQVDGKITQAGQMKVCGIGLVIFGVGGAIVGEDCWQFELKTPAHQECLGEPLPDYYCEKQGDLPVEMRTCKCGGLVIPGIQIGIPTECVCSEWSILGHVEDFQTAYCYGGSS